MRKTRRCNSYYRSKQIQDDKLWTGEPTAKGTKLTYEFEYEVPYSILGKLVDKVKVHKDIEKSNTKLLEDIKKALEAQSKS